MHMLTGIVMVTGNAKKAEEISQMIGQPVEAMSLDILEIQSLDVEMVAREKARAAYALVRRPVIVDDTGMSIDSLGGLPGALVIWFLDILGPEGILRLVEGKLDRRAYVSTCIAYADGKEIYTFVGTVTGTITTEMRGEGGFGYDPIFMPDGSDRTYAEMTAEGKNAQSMRRQALEKLRTFFAEARSE